MFAKSQTQLHVWFSSLHAGQGLLTSWTIMINNSTSDLSQLNELHTRRTILGPPEKPFWRVSLIPENKIGWVDDLDR